MRKEKLRFIDELKRKEKSKNKNIICLCIGSNKIIGDSFGPMVGSRLKKMRFNNNIKFIGDMKEPITGKNVKDIIENIDKNSYLIAIDSALSNIQKNEIFITNGQLELGRGVGKNICRVGDLSIKANVAEYQSKSIENFRLLEKVKIYNINRLSEVVSNGIYEVFKN